jgi:uncharacterized protein
MIMQWGDKRYNSLNYFLKEKFKEKVFKVSLDAGFTCPNRDGKISKGGCIFCSQRGSGDFTGTSANLVRQFYEGIELVSRKWKCEKYIAYFQAFTNTYGEVSDLREKYYSVLNIQGVCGIAIATRPDCLNDEVLDLLHEISKITFLWVELGFQTSKSESAELINRGYENEVYLKATRDLSQRGIYAVTHVIFGLPGESKEDMLKTIDFVKNTDTWGIKFQLLHLIQDTPMMELYNDGRLRFLEQEEYIETVIDAIEILPEDMVIHRLTGDGPQNQLVGPLWSTDKIKVLNKLNNRFVERDTWQGKFYEA